MGITRLNIRSDETFAVYGRGNPEVCAKVFQILAGRSVSPHVSIYDLKDLHNADSVILELDGKELRLPSPMYERLSKYLTDLRNAPRPEEDAFDCSSFAYHMLGIPEVPILNGTATGWNFLEIAGAAELEI